MIRQLIESIFGCQHARTTFPQSPRCVGSLNRFQRRGPTHVTCLSCGKSFEYDWETMAIGRKIAVAAVDSIARAAKEQA